MSQKILFIAPLPPPITGQSVAVQFFYNYLSEISVVYLVNTRKEGFDQGMSSVARFIFVVKQIYSVMIMFNKVDKIYFNVSQSVTGNLRDLCIYLICYKRLSSMTIHLHGGAGMKDLISSSHPILKLLNIFFLKRIGAVIVLSESLKSIYSEFIQPDKLFALNNFASDNYFTSQNLIREKFSSSSKLNLLFLSNFLPGKGHIELLQALSLLSHSVKSKIHIDFAGGFESKTAEVAFTQVAKNISDISINLHGVVDGMQKKNLLKNAHMFCLPTYYRFEGQPISILEAYASGCAVLTTNHGGIFDIFKPDINGIEVLPKSAQSIADAISWSVENFDALSAYAFENFDMANLQFRSNNHLETLSKIFLK